MERASDFEQLIILYKTESKGISLEQFLSIMALTISEPVQEYLNMDKITLVKMLLASNEENKKLHDTLDSLREKTREREAKAEARNEELLRANHSQMEYQVKLMDQLTEMRKRLIFRLDTGT